MESGYGYLLLGAVILAYLVTSTFVRERRRSREFRSLAMHLRLNYAGHGRRRVRLSGLSPFLRSGASFFYDVLFGNHQGHPVLVLDHREGFLTAQRTRVPAYDTYLVLEHDGDFPELLIQPRKLKMDREVMARFAEMEFESVEFSQAFRVAATDRTFAYGVCHPRMMEYLLAHRDLSIEIKGNSIALVFERHLGAAGIPPRLNQLVEIRRLMPEYLFDARPEGT